MIDLLLILYTFIDNYWYCRYWHYAVVSYKYVTSC